MNKKCLFCRKKHLITIECECGGTFCMSCRHRDIHNCSKDDIITENDKRKLDEKLKNQCVKKIKVEKI